MVRFFPDWSGKFDGKDYLVLITLVDQNFPDYRIMIFDHRIRWKDYQRGRFSIYRIVHDTWIECIGW